MEEENYDIHPAVGTEVGMYATLNRNGEFLAWFATYEAAVVACDADPAATAIAYVDLMVQDVESIEEETDNEEREEETTYPKPLAEHEAEWNARQKQ